MGFVVVDGDVLESVGGIIGGVSDANGLRTAEEVGVIDDVKGSTKVEEAENGLGSRIKRRVGGRW